MRDKLWNINQIAEQLDINYWRVRYVLQTRKEIQPVIDTSRAKLYDAKAVRQIKAALKSIDAKQAKQRVTATS